MQQGAKYSYLVDGAVARRPREHLVSDAHIIR